MPADDYTDDQSDRLAGDPGVTENPLAGRIETDPGTVEEPTHRLYGAERFAAPPETPERGLLTLRELRLLEHADRFDEPQQAVLADLLEERIEQFIEYEWPVLDETHPAFADRLRETVCGSNAE